MDILVKIFRFNPEKEESGRLVEYSVRNEPGMSVLEVLHQVHEEQDGTLAYRYSCRGAICGTCAIRINGTARLACKTQVGELLKESDTITLEPLSTMGVIKDLVVDKRPFWSEIKSTMPWLVREKEVPDERMNYQENLDKNLYDQLSRSADCIKCACCVSDCPKMAEMPEFIGPATSVQIYRHLFDPRDKNTDERIDFSNKENGVFACDKHAVCVKVCPKDCRPLRDITFIQKEINANRG